MRRSCLLGLTLFLLLGLLAACGEAPDKENPRLPASEACLTGRVAAVEGAQLLVASLEEGAGKVMSMRSPWASAPWPTRTRTKVPSVRGTGFRWGMAALWRRPSPPGWGR